MGEISTTLTSAAIITYAIEHLKRCEWFKYLDHDSKRLNRTISILAAAVTAVGISYTFDPVVGTLTIYNLTWPAISHAGLAWAKQYLTQQIIYDGVVQKAGASQPTITVVTPSLSQGAE